MSAAALLAGGLATGLGAWMMWPAPRTLPTLRLTIDWPEGLNWGGCCGPGVALSPDGTYLAYLATTVGGKQRLYVHSLRDDKDHLVPGSEGAYGPVFSPDSKQVAFSSAGKLWRAPVDGGTPFEIGSVDPEDRGTAWSIDDSIYSGGGAGISRIAGAGGMRETLTSVDRAAGEVGHRFPASLPGGQAVLFTIFKGGLQDARIALLDLRTRKWRVLMDRTGHGAQYVLSGHLVYLRTGVLMAVPFDLSRLEVTGPPTPVMNDVLFNSGGAAHFSVADTGTLVYVPSPDSQTPTELVWADRTGRITPIELPLGAYGAPAISPDGTRVALERREAEDKSSVVVWDFSRRALTPVTRDSAISESPNWMPAGDTLVFSARSQLGSAGRLVRQRADGMGNPTPLSTAALEQVHGSAREAPSSVSADGTRVFYSQDGTLSDGLKALDLATGRVDALVPPRAFDPRISPDGRWLAYQSVEGGIAEIYVRPYPAVNSARWPISRGGGYSPRWSRDGRELYYQATPSQIFVVTVGPGAVFRASSPQAIFDVGRTVTKSVRRFDVAPDGRLLMLMAEPPKKSIPHVIVNWLETLKRGAPS